MKRDFTMIGLGLMSGHLIWQTLSGLVGGGISWPSLALGAAGVFLTLGSRAGWFGQAPAAAK